MRSIWPAVWAVRSEAGDQLVNSIKSNVDHVVSEIRQKAELGALGFVCAPGRRQLPLPSEIQRRDIVLRLAIAFFRVSRVPRQAKSVLLDILTPNI